MRLLILAALLASACAFAQNESESGKSAIPAPVMGAAPPAVAADQRVTMYPGTNPVVAGKSGVPQFQVDPFWPKPLPNNWILGQVSGVAVDKRGHVWIIQRPRTLSPDERGATLNPPRSKCCAPAPAVIEFDRDGGVVVAVGAGAHDAGEGVAGGHVARAVPDGGDVHVPGGVTGPGHAGTGNRAGQVIEPHPVGHVTSGTGGHR